MSKSESTGKRLVLVLSALVIAGSLVAYNKGKLSFSKRLVTEDVALKACTTTCLDMVMLFTGKLVEQGLLESKEAWRIDKELHTVCVNDCSESLRKGGK